MDQFKESTTFVIVRFDEVNADNIPLFELIPRSWIFVSKGELLTWYPCKVSAKTVQKFVAANRDPDTEKWEKYPVMEVKGQARDHAQGIRRLNRVLKTFDPTPSTDNDENDNTLTNVNILSQTDVSEMLNTSSALPNLTGDLDFTVFEDNVVPEKPLPTKTNQKNMDIRILARENPSTNDLLKNIDGLEKRLTQKINSAKNSILYDIEKKITDLKNTLMFANLGREGVNEVTEARETINTPLPITTLENFLQFEEDLKSAEKRIAMKKLLLSLMTGSGSIKDAIPQVMPAIIAKAVQIHYSGCGRKMKNAVAKRNFSATTTFKCLQETLQEKFVNKSEPLSVIPSRVSRWLSGAGDREGGRAQRYANENAEK
ncbi:uncharacterized protein [Venturia canescens]|uniref:uncharacterized protein n=1 Tax=Venturia canescens TaxID=32260 RepID=UPI001C9BD7A1|nr:uncharacterized protein LOC122418260 [Venturia canescens]